MDRYKCNAHLAEEESSGVLASWTLRWEAQRRGDAAAVEAIDIRIEQAELFECVDLMAHYKLDAEAFRVLALERLAERDEWLKREAGIDSNPDSEVNREARKRADFHRKYPRAMQLRRFGQPRCKKCHRFIARCQCVGPKAEALRLQERETLDYLKARKDSIASHRERYGFEPPWADEMGE